MLLWLYLSDIVCHYRLKVQSAYLHMRFLEYNPVIYTLTLFVLSKSIIFKSNHTYSTHIEIDTDTSFVLASAHVKWISGFSQTIKGNMHHFQHWGSKWCPYIPDTECTFIFSLRSKIRKRQPFLWSGSLSCVPLFVIPRNALWHPTEHSLASRVRLFSIKLLSIVFY